ncbi:hypothetical protein GCM10010300_74610 [Streptomyces olivaceoviridis]|uniref:hypothetical protein n=1 Tax=Streptomyces olivaceoviridis TaxID=1921 RepID=UPI00167B025E|nr:hypothetical protein [Streptomyces olivaceoviridis]GGZ19621.1 hypothetical protein GCM10010300_74610 [Streptomyces olivaceoviridis]
MTSPRRAGRLSGRQVAGPLRALVLVAHPARGGRFCWDRPVRLTLTAVVRRDVEATAPDARHLVFGVDLVEIRLRPGPAGHRRPMPRAAPCDPG